MSDSQSRPLSEDSLSLTDLRKQVTAQASVMAHLAQQISKVYEELTGVYEHSNNEDFLRMCGHDSAARMEILGNMMNAMDIVADEDEWTFPIFIEAQRLWPQKKLR